MIKVNYDSSTGKILGFYVDDIEYSSIPTPHIEIDDDTWQTCINNPGKYIVNLTTLVIEAYTPTDEEILQAKIDALNIEYLPQFESIKTAIAAADALDSSDTIVTLKAAYVSLWSDYNTAMEVIIG